MFILSHYQTAGEHQLNHHPFLIFTQGKLQKHKSLQWLILPPSRVKRYHCNCNQVIFRSVVRHGSESERDNRPDSGFDSNRDVEERYDEAGAGHGDHGHSVSLPGLATQESVSANTNQIVNYSQFTK